MRGLFSISSLSALGLAALTGCTQVAANAPEGEAMAAPARVTEQTRDIYRDWRAALHASFEAAEGGDWRDVSEATGWSWPEFEDYRLYFRARAFEMAGDFTGATELYATLGTAIPQSVYADEARERHLLAGTAAGNGATMVERAETWQNAGKSRFDSFRRSLVLGGVYEAAGRVTEAVDIYRSITIIYPASSIAVEARKHLARLNAQGIEAEPLSRDELRRRADNFYATRVWDAAADDYAQLLKTAVSKAERQELLLRRGITRFYRRAYSQAEGIFDQARKLLPESEKGYEAQFWFAYSLSGLGRADRALAEYERLQSRLLKANKWLGWAAKAQFKIGLIHLQEGDNAKSEAAYELYLKRYPTAGEGSDATWNLAWARYNQKKYREAREAFSDRASRNDSLAPAARYWMARCTHEMGQPEQARKEFAALAESMPLHYYGLLASARLGQAADQPARATFFPGEVTDALSGAPEFHVQRGAILAEMGRGAEAEREFLAALSDAGTREAAFATARLLKAAGRYNAAQRLVWSWFERDILKNDLVYTDLWELAYPVAFESLVATQAGTHGTDPHIVLSLMREESRYQPDVASPADAYGLLQLIEPTARRVAQRIGLPAPSRTDLYQPELNITLGTAYISSLLQNYENNLFLAFAGYNGGPHNVDRWLKSWEGVEMDEFVERIPFTETRNYVKKVTTSLLRYQYLYRPDQSVAQHFLGNTLQASIEN